MKLTRVAQTPPMGWNSWDSFGAAVNEAELMANAEFMAKYLLPHGWEYVVCDIQWYEPKAHSHSYNNFTELCTDGFSRLIPAENRFPSAAGGKGFLPIADKIHSLGLKFGIHILRGIPRQAVHENTPIKGCSATARDIAAPFSLCPWNTDMYGVDASKNGAREYYNSLFELYASWGVDFVKVDDISNTEFKPYEPYSAKAEIELIREAIDRCGRKMVLSLSPGPAPLENAAHLMEYADMWRLTGDFWDEWQKLKAMFERCEKWYPFVGDGHWPDCDMLPLGKLAVNTDGRMSRFTDDEKITLMSLFCIFRSPLIFGGDLRAMDNKTLYLITNDEVLEVNRLGDTPQPVKNGEFTVWKSNAPNGGCYLGIFNLGESEKSFSDLPEKGYVRDLWQKAEVSAPLAVPAHGARLLLIREAE